MNPVYLGDSVYAEHNGYIIILYTDIGNGPEDRIYLDAEVWENLKAYVESLR